MLLTHTYNGGHTYFNTLLIEYIHDLGEGAWAEINEVTDPYSILLASLLLWQPGTHTNYGQGLDWIAVLIERTTKESLHAYLQQNIFDSKEIGFEPTFGGTVTAQSHNAGRF